MRTTAFGLAALLASAQLGACYSSDARCRREPASFQRSFAVSSTCQGGGSATVRIDAIRYFDKRHCGNMGYLLTSCDGGFDGDVVLVSGSKFYDQAFFSWYCFHDDNGIAEFVFQTQDPNSDHRFIVCSAVLDAQIGSDIPCQYSSSVEADGSYISGSAATCTIKVSAAP